MLRNVNKVKTPSIPSSERKVNFLCTLHEVENAFASSYFVPDCSVYTISIPQQLKVVIALSVFCLSGSDNLYVVKTNWIIPFHFPTYSTL